MKRSTSTRKKINKIIKKRQHTKNIVKSHKIKSCKSKKYRSIYGNISRQNSNGMFFF